MCHVSTDDQAQIQELCNLCICARDNFRIPKENNKQKPGMILITDPKGKLPQSFQPVPVDPVAAFSHKFLRAHLVLNAVPGPRQWKQARKSFRLGLEIGATHRIIEYELTSMNGRSHQIHTYIVYVYTYMIYYIYIYMYIYLYTNVYMHLCAHVRVCANAMMKYLKYEICGW